MFYFSDESETIAHSKDPFAPVAYLKFNKLHLADKVKQEKAIEEILVNILLK